MMEVDEDWYEVADEFLIEHWEAQAKQATNTPRRIRLSCYSRLSRSLNQPQWTIMSLSIDSLFFCLSETRRIELISDPDVTEQGRNS